MQNEMEKENNGHTPFSSPLVGKKSAAAEQIEMQKMDISAIAGKKASRPIKFTPKTYQEIYNKMVRTTKNKPFDWFETDLSLLEKDVFYVRNNALPVVLHIVNRKEIVGLKYIVLSEIPRMEFLFNIFLSALNKPVIVVIDELQRRYLDTENEKTKDIGNFIRDVKDGKKVIVRNENVKAVIFRVNAGLKKIVAQLQYLVQGPWYPMRLDIVNDPVQLIADFLKSLEEAGVTPVKEFKLVAAKQEDPILDTLGSNF